jgi:nucleotide-binding universal stress UspA family protein
MYKNILVPMALDHKRNVGAAMDIAHKLLDEGGKITALHVIEAIPGYAAVHLPDDYHEKQQSEAMASLKAELGGVSDVKAQVVTGHAGRTIQDYADQNGSDCIIVASHRPGLQDYFLGSTAAWVVRHAKCAVHVTR